MGVSAVLRIDPVSISIPAALAFLAGLLCLGYLVVPPLRMSSYLLYASFTVFATGFSIYNSFWESWTEMLISVGLSIAAFPSGYVVMTAKVLASDESRRARPYDQGDKREDRRRQVGDFHGYSVILSLHSGYIQPM